MFDESLAVAEPEHLFTHRSSYNNFLSLGRCCILLVRLKGKEKLPTVHQNPKVLLPTPQLPSPNPEDPSPNPEEPPPNPEEPSPNPDFPSPNPEASSPNPEASPPNPEVPSPNPVMLPPPNPVFSLKSVWSAPKPLISGGLAASPLCFVSNPLLTDEEPSPNPTSPPKPSIPEALLMLLCSLVSNPLLSEF
mmetsp:Transcript_13586/g.20420  ORF Transcript_13586/g.20420 Transcript_13586/m.20420 type:complete len:191 (-) Transcript_13586:535-1107(-)